VFRSNHEFAPWDLAKQPATSNHHLSIFRSENEKTLISKNSVQSS